MNLRLVACDFNERKPNYSAETQENTAMQDTCNTLGGHFSARNPSKLDLTKHTDVAHFTTY